jgi:hypothetical protein
MYGAAPHWGTKDGISLAFPQYVYLLSRLPTHPRTLRWLDQNSMQNKLIRQLAMRLIASGVKNEIRQGYIPALLPHLARPLDETEAVSVGCSASCR